MKRSIVTKVFAIAILLFFINSSNTFAQQTAKVYKYESVPNDPLNAWMDRFSGNTMLRIAQRRHTSWQAGKF